MISKTTEKFKRHPTLNRALELADAKYPELLIHIAKDGGDVIELYLEDVEDFNPSKTRIAHYNKWYDEISYARLEYVSE